MKIFTVLLLLFSFFISSILFGQNSWQDMIHDPTANFYDIQKAYEDELGNVPYKKGLGIKQYKRWEYYWEHRVDEKGRFPAPGHVLNEMSKYYNTHSNSRNYTAGSGNWTILGPTPTPNNGTGQLNGNGRLNCIAFHPTDANTIYVGAPSGGVWKTTDNGTTWTQYITGLTRLGISSIVIHPTNPNTIYVATGDRDGGDAPGYGVWRSTDGGLTWSPRNTGMGNRTINELLMDPTNPNIMIAASSNQRIYRTTDAGATWTSSASLGHNPKDIAYHPTNSNIAYASGTRFHKSTDGGVTWTRITNGVPGGVQRIALAVSPNQPDWVYLIGGAGNGLVGIYRSTNSGTSFTTRTTTPNVLDYAINGSGTGSQAWYDLVIAADPTDANTIYTGGVNIWKSTDGGATMNCVSYWVGPSGGVDGVHADQHALDFSPHNNNLYNGNDGGLYLTVDGGTNWTDLSSGLAIAQIYKIGVSQQTLDKAINGYQDNGTAINEGTTFVTEIGGDGMECIIDPTDDTYMYGALYYGDIRRSTNGGTSFASISGPTGEGGGWVTPYKLDPNNANRMFAGYDDIWRNDAVRTGTAWTQISNFANTSNMVDLAIAPSNSNVLYASKGGSSNFYRTNNALAASPTWTDLDANLPASGTPRDIEIDPTDPTHLFIALGNNIYESTNSGVSWTDVSGTLPNISLNTIVIDAESPVEAMYVGMDVGVYYKDNTLADWVLYATGIPNVEVTELEIHYNSAQCKSMLYAATYGQGLWKSDLKDPGNVAALACFETSATNVCMGEPVTFTDNSSYTPTSWTWTITPATFTFVGGTNANSQNPQVSFTAAGTYNVQLNASNATGSDLETKNGYITVSSATNASSFNNDFEAEATCATTSDCGATTCPLASPLWSNLTNGTDDDIDWRIDRGGTPSTGTGPSVDFNPGTATGNYAYLEASSCSGRTGILQTACMTLDQNYDFVFGHHMTGNAVGELHLDIQIGGVWTLDIMPAISGDQGNAWRTTNISLAPYTGQTVKLRFRGITGNGFQSDIAIDDIRLVSNVLLSTRLESFKANCQGGGNNLLEWTMSDNQFKGIFEIEKYIDEQWTTIGTTTATNQREYQFNDPNPLLGENLYRLAMIGNNDTKNYSLNTVANCDVDVYSFVVFPNPFKNEVSLQFHSEFAANLPYRITNLLGQNLLQGQVQASKGLNTFVLPIQDLPKGIYLLHTEGKMIKLVKN
ncbi:T9SS type A sorting domain-containing protein [Aureispira sp. CCB-QB1]|uniref:VPS10 domain-containing protein n=1 Tax=Aureispira sp. CCB-QB1 TaxID=1313421 RepID=UPI000696554B|nr:T9SS type A sorting domain-containing protein [Aureispira sp. CCB-QB1]